MKINDVVVRKSYNKDIIFMITKIDGDVAFLKGLSIRLVADALIEDLELVDTKDEFSEYRNKILKKSMYRNKFLSGKILHLDGDELYLKKCLNLYKDMGIYGVGEFLDEKEMSKNIIKYIKKYAPDVVVITGHDSYNNDGLEDVSNYKNSLHFAKTIREIRKIYSKDQIIIIAGACQSNFELLMAAGANFASSPKRVNIHAYDPAIIAIKACITSIDRTINMEVIIKHSYIKRDGLGGVETKGKMRLFV